jgi:hypothetical protein
MDNLNLLYKTQEIMSFKVHLLYREKTQFNLVLWIYKNRIILMIRLTGIEHPFQPIRKYFKLVKIKYNFHKGKTTKDQINFNRRSLKLLLKKKNNS